MLLSFSYITFLFDGDTGVYMKVPAGWCVPPTSLVVASDDIVVLAGFPGGRSSRYSKSNVKVSDDGLAFEESDITYSSSNDMGCRRTKGRWVMVGKVGSVVSLYCS